VLPSITRLLVWVKFGCSAFKVSEVLFLLTPLVGFWNGLYDMCKQSFPLIEYFQKKEEDKECPYYEIGVEQLTLILAGLGVSYLILTYVLIQRKINNLMTSEKEE